MYTNLKCLLQLTDLLLRIKVIYKLVVNDKLVIFDCEIYIDLEQS